MVFNQTRLNDSVKVSAFTESRAFLFFTDEDPATSTSYESRPSGHPISHRVYHGSVRRLEEDRRRISCHRTRDYILLPTRPLPPHPPHRHIPTRFSDCLPEPQRDGGERLHRRGRTVPVDRPPSSRRPHLGPIPRDDGVVSGFGTWSRRGPCIRRSSGASISGKSTVSL